jgi:hypothetical protein
MNVQFAQHRTEAVRVLYVVCSLIPIRQKAQPIPKRLLASRDRPHEESFLTYLRQVGHHLSGCAINDPGFACLRYKRPYNELLDAIDKLLVHAQKRERVAVIGVNDPVDLGFQLFFYHVQIPSRGNVMLLSNECSMRDARVSSTRAPLMAFPAVTPEGSAALPSGRVCLPHS